MRHSDALNDSRVMRGNLSKSSRPIELSPLHLFTISRHIATEISEVCNTDSRYLSMCHHAHLSSCKDEKKELLSVHPIICLILIRRHFFTY